MMGRGSSAGGRNTGGGPGARSPRRLRDLAADPVLHFAHAALFVGKIRAGLVPRVRGARPADRAL